MKILVICQYYYPEPFRITDICEELVNLGNEVTVVTGQPNYPMGELYEGYEKGKRVDEIINGVKVHRCRTLPRKMGSLNRLRNYFSYACSSKKYVKGLKEEFDIVFINQLSPVMMAEAGIAYKKKFGKKLVLYCLDLWPESLCVGGIKRGSLIYKIFDRISKRIYRAVDKILITSQSFRMYLVNQFTIANEKIAYLPQYAEMQFLDIKEKEPTDEFRLLFAGNIGAAQGVDTIVDAARILKEEKIIFDIVGEGTELARLQKQAKDLPNVIFHGRKPLEEMPKYYEAADAMLVTLTNDPIISRTLPGKVQTYMAAGRPIVGAINGETALILQESQGGYCCEAENGELFAANILNLRDSNDAVSIGQRNKEYYINNFSKSKFMQTFTKHLTI